MPVQFKASRHLDHLARGWHSKEESGTRKAHMQRDPDPIHSGKVENEKKFFLNYSLQI